MRSRYFNKAPFSTLRPNPCHWTRKDGSRSWKQKVGYDSEDEAEEFLKQNPGLVAAGYRVYKCSVCSKWHCGHLRKE